jgi:hypothetical protein
MRSASGPFPGYAMAHWARWGDDKAALRVAHREYKALLPIVQADTGEPGPLLDEFRPKRWWKGPPSERAFQLVVWRYRHLLPDRETVTLRRLIRVRQYEK